LTASQYSAQQAEARGWSISACPTDQFDKELDALVKRILANSWFTNRAVKRMMVDLDGLGLKPSLALERYRQPGRAPDYAQRVSAFSRRNERHGRRRPGRCTGTPTCRVPYRPSPSPWWARRRARTPSGATPLATWQGFAGTVYAVNEKYSAIDGHPCHPSVRSLPENAGLRNPQRAARGPWSRWCWNAPSAAWAAS